MVWTAKAWSAADSSCVLFRVRSTVRLILLTGTEILENRTYGRPQTATRRRYNDHWEEDGLAQLERSRNDNPDKLVLRKRSRELFFNLHS